MNTETVYLELEPEDAYFAYHAASAWLLSEKEPPEYEFWKEEDLRNALMNIQVGANGVTLRGVELKALTHAVKRGMEDAPIDHPAPRKVWEQLVAVTPSDEELEPVSGELYYGSEWDQIREQVLQRDFYECVQCGISKEGHISRYGMGLNVHHIKPFREFDEKGEANQLQNLVTLCASCHAKLESDTPDAFQGVDLGV
jgi:hypothetical protein